MSIIGDALKSLGNLFVKKSGDTMSGDLILPTNKNVRLICNWRGTSYVEGAKGRFSALYGYHHPTDNMWYPLICIQTKGLGSWQIGNYADEKLEFVYFNNNFINNSTNKASVLKLEPPSSIPSSRTILTSDQFQLVYGRYPSSTNGTFTVDPNSYTVPFTIPSGYKALFFGTPQSNGFVHHGAYVLNEPFGATGSGTCIVWMRCASGDQTGYIRVPILCVKV